METSKVLESIIKKYNLYRFDICGGSCNMCGLCDDILEYYLSSQAEGKGI